jgi:hypothetical protein
MFTSGARGNDRAGHERAPQGSYFRQFSDLTTSATMILWLNSRNAIGGPSFMHYSQLLGLWV